MTPAGTSNELDAQHEWEEKKKKKMYLMSLMFLMSLMSLMSQRAARRGVGDVYRSHIVFNYQNISDY